MNMTSIYLILFIFIGTREYIPGAHRGWAGGAGDVPRVRLDGTGDVPRVRVERNRRSRRRPSSPRKPENKDMTHICPLIRSFEAFAGPTHVPLACKCGLEHWRYKV